jgi:hypothetical protein
MTKITSSLLLATVLAFCLHVAAAQAQYVRTCVSANGNDANTCHCSQPCRTFQRAHDQTLDQGELTVLDTGGYGPVTITKSISIVNDGVGEASIQVSGGGVGITVNAPAGAGYVNLRGITIQGVGFGGGTGLKLNSGFALTVTNCVIRNHTSNGILYAPNGSSSLSVSDTLVADNGDSGIIVTTGSFGITVKAALSRVDAHNNSSSGIAVTAANTNVKLNATVADSVAANNGGDGIQVVTSTPSSATSLTVVRSVVANNATGLSSQLTNSTLRVGQSTVTGNTVSWSIPGGGVLQSYGDNNINGNGDGDPAPSTIAKK